MKVLKEIIKFEVSGKSKLELDLMKFKVYECVEQLKTSTIDKYIDYLKKSKETE